MGQTLSLIYAHLAYQKKREQWFYWALVGFFWMFPSKDKTLENYSWYETTYLRMSIAEKCCFWATASKVPTTHCISSHFSAPASWAQGGSQQGTGQSAGKLPLEENRRLSAVSEPANRRGYRCAFVLQLPIQHRNHWEPLFSTGPSSDPFLKAFPGSICCDQPKWKPWAGGGDSTVTVSSSLQGEQQQTTKSAGEKLLDEGKPVQAQPEQPSPARIAQPILPASFWKGFASARYISH